MKKLKIRAATHDDMPVLKQFEQGVISAERPFDPTLKSNPITYYDLAGLIDNDNVHLIVAELDNELVASGYARIEKAKPYVNYAFYSYLGFMYVSPEHRGKGVNKYIIDALKSWSQEQGVTMMHLDVFAENDVALRAYLKAGFKGNLLEMRLDIAN